MSAAGKVRSRPRFDLAEYKQQAATVLIGPAPCTLHEACPLFAEEA